MGEFGVLAVLGEFGVFGLFTVLGVLGVFAEFTSPWDVELVDPVDPVDGVVVGLGAGVEVSGTVTGRFSNVSIDEMPAFEPSASWMLMAFAAATAPPLRSPTPRTEAAPTTTHLFFVIMMVFRSTW